MTRAIYLFVKEYLPSTPLSKCFPLFPHKYLFSHHCILGYKHILVLLNLSTQAFALRFRSSSSRPALSLLTLANHNDRY